MRPPINRLPRARPVPDAAARPVPDEVLRQLADLARVPALVDLFAELLQPYYGIPPTPLHEVLHGAAKRAGWAPPSASATAQDSQGAATRGRTIQREQDLALRRILVAYVYKQLRPSLQAKPGSTGTAQAIISRLKTLPFDRVPPMSVRTIKADILYMKKNENFGI
jgi:hypothetical protein